MITWLKNLLSGDSAEARKKRKKEERAARERRKRIRERERELMRRRGIGTWKSSFFLAAPVRCGFPMSASYASAAMWVLCHQFGDSSTALGAVALVLESDPHAVVFFDSWRPMIAWLMDNETKQGPTHSVTFAAPIVKLTSRFAALDETGPVHVWSKKSTVHAPYPPDENEVFKEVWDRYVLFGDPIRRWPSRLPEALDYTPKSLPLPPIQKMATGGCYNVSISHAGQLFIWGYKSENWPEIVDVNPISAVEFKAAVIVTDTGKGLQIVIAAAGRAHVVALAADGLLWSADDGLNEQLGIGIRQFGLCTE
ncbi:hypothetical protein CNMCM6936_002164 [Aspergillus lentulus]|nr:hypothetical protein CNMCM6936_002164 [Aspergillus lentulus]KAF4186028.1 hypothetical protein CNMCM7927_006076 [Aspergillus lentulus]